jgi:hypothetical protein
MNQLTRAQLTGSWANIEPLLPVEITRDGEVIAVMGKPGKLLDISKFHPVMQQKINALADMARKALPKED